MREKLIRACLLRAEGDFACAEANVSVYLNQSVGIGEHNKIVEAIEEELDTMAVASDRIEMLNKYFVENTWEFETVGGTD